MTITDDCILQTLKYILDDIKSFSNEPLLPSTIATLSHIYADNHPNDRPDWVSALANGNYYLFDDLVKFVNKERKLEE